MAVVPEQPKKFRESNLHFSITWKFSNQKVMTIKLLESQEFRGILWRARIESSGS